MPIEILMPALSPTMEEGKLAKWLVKEGDSVSSGDVIAEIETDKATMEVEAVDEGTIGKILVDEGTEGVAVNKLIALLLEDGEDAAALSESADSGSSSSAQAAAPVPTAEPMPEASPTVQAQPPSQANGHAAAGERLFATPLARRVAEQNDIDLTKVSGSGPRGRIIKADVEAAISGGGATVSVSSQPSTALATTSGTAVARSSGMSDEQIKLLFEEGSYDVVPHDNMRATIASRLTESKQNVPHFYLTVQTRLDELLSARKRMNDIGEGKFKLSVNDFIIKALALALRDVPDANAVWMDGGTLKYTRCDVGVAVAVEGGLFTPVVRHADLKTMREISNEMRDLAERARNRRLAPHEYQGGTTSISNLGMFGIQEFDAVINPPHATILAVGAGEQRPIVVDGEMVVATMMSCTLSCDHRVVDGALGAELLGAFKRYIEDPVGMLV